MCRSNPCIRKAPKREFIETREMELKFYKSLGTLSGKDVKKCVFEALQTMKTKT